MGEFIGSVEFYIIMLAIAFAVVGAAMRPAEKGKAITMFAKGLISPADTDESMVEIECLADCSLAVRRKGVYLDTPDCEINYSITVIGNDIKISEKRVTSSIAELSPATVDVEFSFVPPHHGRYHIYLESEWSGEWTSGTIRTTPGLQKQLQLHR